MSALCNSECFDHRFESQSGDGGDASADRVRGVYRWRRPKACAPYRKGTGMSRLVSRATATMLAAGAVLGATALPASAADHGRHYPQRSQVALGAIQYDSPGRDNR